MKYISKPNETENERKQKEEELFCVKSLFYDEMMFAESEEEISYIKERIKNSRFYQDLT